jgi:hypothetical protein
MGPTRKSLVYEETAASDQIPLTSEEAIDRPTLTRPS